MSNLSFPPYERKLPALDPHNYLVSLLNRAFTAQLISEAKMQTIQTQVMEVLKEIIFRYTGGQSSSVTTATAQSLINSILYCIDVRLLALDSPEESLRELDSKTIREIYQDGLALVDPAWKKPGSCLSKPRYRGLPPI